MTFEDLTQAARSAWMQLSEPARIALIAIAILFIGVYFSKIAQSLTRRGLSYRRADPEISLLVSRIVQWSILFFAILISARQLGVDITAALAGLGILGFTIGFALQDVSKNFMAGLLILLQQPFELGDTIQISGFTGTILDINLRDTEIRTVDGLTVRIPNGDVFTQPVTNFTGLQRRRLQISLNLAYDNDLEKVRRITRETIRSIEGVLDDPAIDIRFEAFTDYSIRMNIAYWYAEDKTNYSKALDAGISGIKAAFDGAGIQLAVPYYKFKTEDGRRSLVEAQDKKSDQSPS